MQREPQRRRVYVVGGLRQVDVRVGRETLIVAARRPHQLERAVGDDLVDVHVGRRARPTLDHVHAEVIVVHALPDLAARRDDRIGALRVEDAELLVRLGRGFLHRGERPHEGRELVQRHAGDREVLDGAQRLDAIQRLGGHIALAEQVVLTARHAGEGEGRERLLARERRVGALDALIDDLGGARQQGGVQCRLILEQLLERLLLEVDELRRLHGPRRRTVAAVLEEQALAHDLTRSEGGDLDVHAGIGVLDGDAAADDDAEDLALLAFAEQDLVGGHHPRLCGAVEVPKERVREPRKERVIAEGVGSDRGSHRLGRTRGKVGSKSR